MKSYDSSFSQPTTTFLLNMESSRTLSSAGWTNAYYDVTAKTPSSNTTSLMTDVGLAQNIVILGTVMTYTFLVVGTIGLASNIFSMVVVASSRQLRQQPRNWFIFNQSLADCLHAFFIVAFAIKTPNTKLYVRL